MKKHRTKIREIEELGLDGVRIIRPNGKSFRSYLPYKDIILQAESGLEERLLEILWHDPNVKSISTQPETIQLNHRYTPDIKVEYLDGSIYFFEVKYAKDLTPKMQAKLNLAKEYYERKGFQFKIMTEQHIQNIQTNN